MPIHIVDHICRRPYLWLFLSKNTPDSHADTSVNLGSITQIFTQFLQRHWPDDLTSSGWRATEAMLSCQWATEVASPLWSVVGVAADIIGQ